MKHGERITRFLRDETGAVTVDYVVLSGALTGIGVTTAAAVTGGVNTLAQKHRIRTDGNIRTDAKYLSV